MFDIKGKKIASNRSICVTSLVQKLGSTNIVLPFSRGFVALSGNVSIVRIAACASPACCSKPSEAV